MPAGDLFVVDDEGRFGRTPADHRPVLLYQGCAGDFQGNPLSLRGDAFNKDVRRAGAQAFPLGDIGQVSLGLAQLLGNLLFFLLDTLQAFAAGAQDQQED